LTHQENTKLYLGLEAVERLSAMVEKIAIFSPKGGVGKTTTTLHLGWMLAMKGKRVILVDSDPQCALTERLLEADTEDEPRIEAIYNTNSNIKTGLAPAFEAQPKAIEAIDCIPIQNRSNLFLLPGHLGLAEYEVILGVAQELSGSIQSLRNLRNIPGSIAELLNKTATKFNADYILIDMSPGLGSINQNLLMTSDFFIVPTIANFSSLLAINSLAKVLPKWYAWAKRASSFQILKEATYPFPDVRLHFLGTIIQNYRLFRGEPAKATQAQIQELEQAVSTKLVPMLRKNNMLLPQQFYIEHGVNTNFTLTKIPNFDILINLSEAYGTFVYDLTIEQLRQKGIIQEATHRRQEEFRLIFSDLADKIIGLTSTYAISA
jgi:cellulose biosynthesis protein BcsQ